MKHSKTLGHNGDEYFSEESTFNVTISYEFVGFETVSVQAGDFNCLHIRMVTSDGFEEETWYSYAVLSYVKVTDTAGQADIITYELNSYVLAHESAEPVAMASNLFLAMFFIFIAATVMAVIYASMIFRGKKPLESQTPQAESLEKGIYRP
jgi:hypothetical protein